MQLLILKYASHGYQIHRQPSIPICCRLDRDICDEDTLLYVNHNILVIAGTINDT